MARKKLNRRRSAGAGRFAFNIAELRPGGNPWPRFRAAAGLACGISGKMPDYLIERVMPGVAQLSVSDLKATSRLSFAKMQEAFPMIRWLHSYATDDILYCVYRAPNEEIIRQYASGSALPVHKISEIRVTLDPTTVDER